eukprot:762820-Hanusia_phi.AAC.3
MAFVPAPLSSSSVSALSGLSPLSHGHPSPISRSHVALRSPVRQSAGMQWGKVKLANTEAGGDKEAQMKVDNAVEEAVQDATKELKAEEVKEEKKENLMTKVKDAGVAGLVAYAIWEFISVMHFSNPRGCVDVGNLSAALVMTGLVSFWAVSVPTAIFAYHQTTGEWPSFDNPESTAKVKRYGRSRGDQVTLPRPGLGGCLRLPQHCSCPGSGPHCHYTSYSTFR